MEEKKKGRQKNKGILWLGYHRYPSKYLCPNAIITILLYCRDICSEHLFVMFARGSWMVVWRSPRLAARILSTTYNGQSQ